MSVLDKVTTAISGPTDGDDNGESRAAALRLSTAVLMIDVARADHVFEESEFERVLQLVESHFKLDPEDAAELVNLASDKADDLISAYEFTSELHKHLDEAEKARIVGLLWQLSQPCCRPSHVSPPSLARYVILMHAASPVRLRVRAAKKIQAIEQEPSHFEHLNCRALPTMMDIAENNVLLVFPYLHGLLISANQFQHVTISWQSWLYPHDANRFVFATDRCWRA